MIWLPLGACLVVIAIAGYYLSRFGDVIAEKTGLSGSWVGLMLLASVTSLPELVTGVSAVTLAQAPDIAVGDALGSTVFNLFLLVIIDVLHRPESLYWRASQGHVLAAAFGVALMALTGISLSLVQAGLMPRLGHIGLYTPVILLAYGGAMRALYQHGARQPDEQGKQADRYARYSLRRALSLYLVAAACVVAAGLWLPSLAKSLALAMGWEQSIVGTLIVAAITSAPELAVTMAALRLGALNMAIGNLLGSNLFDIAILAVDDVLYQPGPLFGHVSPAHLTTAFTATFMTGVFLIGMVLRRRERLLNTVGWTSLLLTALFLINAYSLYHHHVP
ncbi:MAG: sodium:calcium antiporter [Gammaproteobacteria bacterium]|nr:sodium:calcium antiporter [Gammaproteobacteria bacterium]